MLIPTVVMGSIALILLYMGYKNGSKQHITGMVISAKMFIDILPLLFFALIIAGMVQVLVPQETILKWLGTESGLRGILIGSIAGSLIPGGPYVSYPIAAGLIRAGAGIGTTVAFLTGWSLIAVSRLPMELGILGWRFVLIRILCTFFFPPIAGLLARKLFY